MSTRYQKSEAFLAEVQKLIPLGSQTFSKSRTQFPFGVSPYFIERGQGSHVWDLDGNEYIDFINGLASITLGYNDPDVNAAVHSQLDNGVIFSLPHPLEENVAKKIVEMVPCAEMVRFGKNGSDATAGAIRLARAFTGRDHVLVCGYHGWQDWYIGSTARSKGVPKATRELTHVFPYNDPEKLKNIFSTYPGQIAAVILEPMNTTFPDKEYLENVKNISHENGALLIFDETITGFRYSNGGAQEYFNVIPDLATFGKGLANGFPLSVVAGRADIMRLMEEVFFSFTFGGETLSLAAAKATMEKLQNQPVLKRLAEQGQKIFSGVQSLILKHKIGDFLSISGHPSWSFLNFKDFNSYTLWQIKTLFLQEVFSRGVLTIGTHNMSFSHSDQDIEKILACYDEVFSLLHQAVGSKKLNSMLSCKPLEPLFKLR